MLSTTRRSTCKDMTSISQNILLSVHTCVRTCDADVHIEYDDHRLKRQCSLREDLSPFLKSCFSTHVELCASADIFACICASTCAASVCVCVTWIRQSGMGSCRVAAWRTGAASLATLLSAHGCHPELSIRACMRIDMHAHIYVDRNEHGRMLRQVYNSRVRSSRACVRQPWCV